MRCQFTPETMDKVRALVACGVSRDEIAIRLGTTVASLQVMASRNKISLKGPNGRRKRRTRAEMVAWRNELDMKRAHEEFKVNLVNPKIKLKLELEKEALSLLVMQAEKLGVTVDVVCRRLLETIARENLYKAVMDDAA